MMEERDSLANKYVKGEMDLSKHIRKQNCSNAWKGMVSAANLLRKGERTQVQNGRHTLY